MSLIHNQKETRGQKGAMAPLSLAQKELLSCESGSLSDKDGEFWISGSSNGLTRTNDFIDVQKCKR